MGLSEQTIELTMHLFDRNALDHIFIFSSGYFTCINEYKAQQPFVTIFKNLSCSHRQRPWENESKMAAAIVLCFMLQDFPTLFSEWCLNVLKLWVVYQQENFAEFVQCFIFILRLCLTARSLWINKYLCMPTSFAFSWRVFFSSQGNASTSSSSFLVHTFLFCNRCLQYLWRTKLLLSSQSSVLLRVLSYWSSGRRWY